MNVLLPEPTRLDAGQTRAPLVSLRGISRLYGEGATAVTALDGVDLDIHQGAFVALLGPSGSGKTTLMNLIGLLDRPSDGSYRLAGEEVGSLDSDALARLRRERIGFIFQQYSLIPTLSAVENVELPALYAGTDAKARRARAAGLLATLGLGERLDHRPTQLSGGQQQRVSIARALMNGGDIILADEPTGALDSRTGAEVMEILHALHRAGHTIILVTHAEELAAQAERRIRLRDGRIIEDNGAEPPQTAAADQAPESGGAPRITDTLRTATRALGANILRTALTLLGIVIGIASVIVMLAIGNGEKEAMLQRLSFLGPDLLTVNAGARNRRSIDGVTATLVDADRQAILALPNVRAAISDYQTAVTLRGAGNDVRTTAQGTTPELPEVRNWPVALGRFFTEAEIAGFAAVAVLGQTAARNMFQDGIEPVGRYVLLNNVPFQVIGLLEPRGATGFGRDQDDVVFIPLSTARLRLHGQRHVQSITIQVEDTRQVDATQEAITALLAERHGAIDFQVRNTAQILATVTASRDGATAMLGAIALVSLLVGGIGVMNIMLVSVTERTREIGLRMAVGARRRDVLRQFSLEALMICTAGGLAGVAIGLGGTALLDALDWPITVEPVTVALALCSACVTGLVVGYLPARKAAGLDPVRALANE